MSSDQQAINENRGAIPFSRRVERKMPLLLAIWLFLSVLGPHQELYKVFFHGVVIPAVLVLLFSRRLVSIRRDPLFWVSIAFFSYAAITTFIIGLGPINGHLRALRWAIEASFCLLALWAWMPDVARRAYWWARYLLFITLAASVAAIIKFVIFENMQGRLSGLGGLHNPIHTGGVLLTYLAIGHFVLLRGEKALITERDRWLLLFATLGVGLAVLFSESRGPIGALLIYGLFIGCLQLVTRPSFKFVIWTLVGVAGVVGVVSGLHGADNYLGQLLDRGSSYRLEIWRGYIDYPPDSWWLGFGLGTEKWYVPAVEAYWKPNDVPVGHPHSVFIGTLVETGIIGSIFLSFMVGLLVLSIMVFAGTSLDKLRLFGILGLICILSFTTGQGVISSIKTFWLTLWFPVIFIWFWTRISDKKDDELFGEKVG
ncbi:O-antigen ligase family protein [Marinobacter sp.]|uniref:O-antigen ligase family protein n=1 Tax=Marinobacter sp. TaxID=50741 RepID=UPI0034A17F86